MNDPIAPLPSLSQIQEYLRPHGVYDLVWIKSPGGGIFAGTIAGCVLKEYPGTWKQVGFRQRKIMGWKLRHMLEHGDWGPDAPPDFVNHHQAIKNATATAPVVPLFDNGMDDEEWPVEVIPAPMAKAPLRERQLRTILNNLNALTYEVKRMLRKEATEDAPERLFK